MKQIPLTQGKFALVDDCDFKELSNHKWCYHEGYAARNLPKNEGGGLMRMHRQILNTPKGMDSDHRDTKKLNNTRSNLRVCTKSQNAMNRKENKNNTSGHKGVAWHKGKWMAQIMRDSKMVYLGRFFCLVRAAQAYDKAAIELHGEFAKLNFPRRLELDADK